MPYVSGKKFPYTTSGKAAAKRALKKLVRKDGKGGPGDYTMGGLKPIEQSFSTIKPPVAPSSLKKFITGSGKADKDQGMSIPDNYSDNTDARSAIGLKTSQVMRPGPRPVSPKDGFIQRPPIGDPYIPPNPKVRIPPDVSKQQQPIQPIQPKVPLQPKIDYGNAPQGTPPPTQPLPSGAIGWFWYNGQWAPNYQYRPANVNRNIMGKLNKNRR